MRKIMGLAVFFLVLLPAFTLAADFRTETVSKNETVKNLYVAGQNVNVDANVTGDLNAAGNNVNINGTVENSAQVAGSTINIRKDVGGSVRLAGGTINIDSQVGEDLVVMGGQVTLGPNSVVKGDLIVFGGSVIINGNIDGDIIGTVADLTINSTIGGNVEMKEVRRIVLGSEAVVNGKLSYASPTKSEIDETKVKNGVEYKEVSRTNLKKDRNYAAGFSLLGLIGVFLLLFLLSKMAPKTLEKFVATSVTSPWANMGIGFVTLIVVPVAVVMLLLSVIGFPFAGIVFLVYVLLLALAGLLSALLLGTWLFKVLGNKERYEITVLTIFLGVILTIALKVIPVIGWLALFLLFLLALGSLVRMLYIASTEQRKAE